MRRAALVAGAFALLMPLAVGAQGTGPVLVAGQAACSVPEFLPPARLSGLWTLTLWPEGGSEAQPVSRGALLLEPHPEYAGSVRGDLKRSSEGKDLQALVSGDVTEGEFHLDESDDGERMSAVWSGSAEDCAGRITLSGQRRPAEGESGAALRFRLQRVPSW